MKPRFSKLRTCASCEWIFTATVEAPECPRCGFGSYGARYVYGTNAYHFRDTQSPWKRRMMGKYGVELDREIKRSKKD